MLSGYLLSVNVWKFLSSVPFFSFLGDEVGDGLDACNPYNFTLITKYLEVPPI